MRDGATSTVVAVVTAFNPDDELLALVADVVGQVEHLVVVDDGSSDGLNVLDAVVHAGVEVLHQANAGVAAALNRGVEAALARGATAVLTLDQDSRVPMGYVAAAEATWRGAEAAGIPVGLVSAQSYSGHPTPTRGHAGSFARAFDPMQSGTLVPATTYAAVGLYDAGLVIDGVDSEFTVRCLAAGLEPLVGVGCALGHGQGERVPAELAGWRIGRKGASMSYNRHSPERVYSMARNGTLLTRRHLRDQPGWVLRRLTEEAKAHTLRLAFSPDRADLARAAVKGVRDGLRREPD